MPRGASRVDDPFRGGQDEVFAQQRLEDLDQSFIVEQRVERVGVVVEDGITCCRSPDGVGRWRSALAMAQSKASESASISRGDSIWGYRRNPNVRKRSASSRVIESPSYGSRTTTNTRGAHGSTERAAGFRGDCLQSVRDPSGQLFSGYGNSSNPAIGCRAQTRSHECGYQARDKRRGTGTAARAPCAPELGGQVRDASASFRNREMKAIV